MSLIQTRNTPRYQSDADDVYLRLARIQSALRLYAKRRKAYHQSVGELSALSDRELADIGVPRSHIRRVAREHAQLEV